MTFRGRDITVAGGGIAGLAVAQALAARGAQVALHEQAPAISEVGAGLQISPNGMRVIDALGLGSALRAASLPARAVVLHDGRTGRQVARLDLGRAAGDYLLVHRARLIDVLATGARSAGVTLHLGSRIAPDPEREFTIGADGLHSEFRAALNGAEAPVFTGQVAWRAIIDADDAPPEAKVFMGPGRHLVSYPLRGGLRNIVAVEERADWTQEGWHHAGDPDALRRAFAGFGGPVPGWLAQVETVGLWGLFRHPVARNWHGPGLAIIGDAAHPTLPFLAQGANLALEDAWTLAEALATGDDALPGWQAARRPRVTRAIDAATANARNYHLGGIGRIAAHGALRIAGRLAPGALLRRFDWLYGHDVTAASRNRSENESDKNNQELS